MPLATVRFARALLLVHLLRIKNPPTPGSGYGLGAVRVLYVTSYSASIELLALRKAKKGGGGNCPSSPPRSATGRVCAIPGLPPDSLAIYTFSAVTIAYTKSFSIRLVCGARMRVSTYICMFRTDARNLAAAG